MTEATPKHKQIECAKHVKTWISQQTYDLIVHWLVYHSPTHHVSDLSGPPRYQYLCGTLLSLDAFTPPFVTTRPELE
jgi:hypothetical protein